MRREGGFEKCEGHVWIGNRSLIVVVVLDRGFWVFKYAVYPQHTCNRSFTQWWSHWL